MVSARSKDPKQGEPPWKTTWFSSPKRLNAIDPSPDIGILAFDKALSLKKKVSAVEDSLNEKEGRRPAVAALIREVFGGFSTLQCGPIGPSVSALMGFKPDYLCTILDEDVIQRATFASLEEHLQIVLLTCEEKVKASEARYAGLEDSSAALRQELESLKDDLRATKDELHLTQVEKASLEKRVEELGDVSAQTQEENKNLLKEMEVLQKDRHFLITKGIPYFFNEGASDSVFQRQLKRVSYYQKAVGGHGMALHYHPSFEGVNLEDMLGYDSVAVSKAQEAKKALRHLSLDYHKVLPDNSRNHASLLMGICAKRLLPHPEASTSRTVVAQGSSGTGDIEGEVNQA
ncbi:OLC1v1024311C1 [Oldenlandia corymbosa var. corymbosa]|uniref:OLC1v1024311C1 n=1 Tax=Oldenlandia corymbosa var. corymbosa TaxID=529605 RepID=A0AAV1C2S0_OLDCO|nr:OLC1v1024311C1 [Oldenlandia corymbosa var. corymbosa]